MSEPVIRGRDKPLHIGLDQPLPKTAFIMGDPARVEMLLEYAGGGRVLSRKRGYVIGLVENSSGSAVLASHGIGGPSMLILVEELSMLGTRRFIRLGTTGAFAGNVGIGDILVAGSACMIPGTCGLSLYHDKVPPPLAADPRLAEKALRLLASAGLEPKLARVFCSDSFYAESWRVFKQVAAAGCHSVDMETASLYGISAIRGLESLSVLVVSNIIRGQSEEVWSSEPMSERFKRVFRALLPLAFD
ncbi:MAG: hypothetical protein F7C34_01125 [Desulfurococcales archaeon]|nr:hypothetical protein [Desulfurococcales archaeon]